MITLEVGRHLFTRDGRRHGNAIVVAHLHANVWTIESDFGTRSNLTTSEIFQHFYTRDALGTQIRTDPEVWNRQRVTTQLKNEY